MDGSSHGAARVRSLPTTARAPTRPERAVSGLLRFITCGSVDDGKSTLIGRLLYDSKGLLADQLTALEAASRRRGLADVDLSLLTDGLVAEREQGITIDVAYRYFATPARKFIIGDSPGHPQYTRNMVTAASTADVAVLLVDAESGIQPQTRRHAYLAHWLGIRRIVVAVNKMDLVGYAQARFDAIRDDFAQLARPLEFDAAHAIPLSALRGDMVVDRGEAMPWYAGPTLLAWLETAPAKADDPTAPLRFPVQRVARVARGNGQAEWTGADFRGYQGTVAAGAVAVGDEIVAVPSGARAIVARILTPAGDAGWASAERAVTLCLDREIDISRGDVLAAAAAPPRVAASFDAELCWFDAEPLDAARTYLLKHGAHLVRARVANVGERLDVATMQRAHSDDPIGMNDIARVTIRAQRPVAVDPYRDSCVTGAFILIDETTNRTVAAGTIG